MSLDKEVEALRNVAIFRKIDAAKLRLLAFISERVQFAPGEVLCKQGEIGDSAFIILSGNARVVVSSNGSERTVARLGQEDVVGEIAILCDVPRTATVIAEDELTGLSVDKETFLKLLQEFPDMALQVMRVLAARLERTTRDLADLKAKVGEAGT
ncbi:MAG: cyclic nucleotide-binding domain-containing protein [Hyphomicrobiales bacterium]|nr:cyclic nucleotide-binding domain-containing protein [Hyphomicrobiales bacterium]